MTEMTKLFQKDNTTKIITLLDYLSIIQSSFTPINNLGWIYRGQANSEWKLIPKAGRNGTNLAQIIIEKSFKNRIMKELNELGINYSFLFPGLDGLSALINEETSGILR